MDPGAGEVSLRCMAPLTSAKVGEFPLLVRPLASQPDPTIGLRGNPDESRELRGW